MIDPVSLARTIAARLEGAADDLDVLCDALDQAETLVTELERRIRAGVDREDAASLPPARAK